MTNSLIERLQKHELATKPRLYSYSLLACKERYQCVVLYENLLATPHNIRDYKFNKLHELYKIIQDECKHTNKNHLYVFYDKETNKTFWLNQKGLSDFNFVNDIDGIVFEED